MKYIKLVLKSARRSKRRTVLTIMSVAIAVFLFSALRAVLDGFDAVAAASSSQRVAIARAIVTDPTLLLADEPTGDLDAKSAGEVLTLLQRLNDEFKKTIVMVTHDPHAAERARHLLHLEKGTLVEQSAVGQGR